MVNNRNMRWGNWRWILGLSLVLLIAYASIASAVENPAVYVRATAVVVLDGYSTGCDGWRFVPTSDLYVTSLGYFDADGDGLLHSHNVGIFEQATGILVTPLTAVQPADPLFQQFRWHDINPVQLLAGSSYFLSADGNAPYDHTVHGTPSQFILRPVVGYQEYWWNANNYLSIPEFIGNANLLNFGANFKFSLEAPVATEAESWSSIKSLY